MEKNYMVRVNINFDDELYNELSRIKNKSDFVRNAVREKLSNIKEKELKKSLIEGYKKEGKNMSEWDSTITDGWD
jgi:metal-responsive CopG/Arc/MetJ family transcriptional regulator